MSARRHVAVDGLGFGDVDDGVEEVGFAVLAAEILCRGERGVSCLVRKGRRDGWKEEGEGFVCRESDEGLLGS